jgi:hypothetical protein
MVVAGINVEFLRSKKDVEEAVNVATEKGASGVCFFVYPLQHPELKDVIKEELLKFKK